MLELLGLEAIFSLIYTANKAGALIAPPLFFVASRMLVSGIILAVYGWYKNLGWAKARHSIVPIGVTAFFLIFMAFAPAFIAISYVTSAKYSLVFSFAPFASAFFSFIHFKERLTSTKIIGFMLGISGIFILLVSGKGGGARSFLSVSWPDALLLLSAICYAYGFVLMKRFNLQHTIHPLVLNGSIMLIGGSLLMISSYIFDSFDAQIFRSPLSFALILTISVALNIFIFVMRTMLLRTYSATLVTFFITVEPVYAAFYGWLFLSEKLHFIFFICAFIVMAGLYLFYRQELQHATRKG